MNAFVFPERPVPSVPITGQTLRFPLNRVFCVGRNYAAHAVEMGNEVDREAPFYFTKSTASVVESGVKIPYPLQTQDYHHEMEFAVFIGKPAFQADEAQAMDAVFGYACALDMTRRDLQAAAKDKRRPWDIGKDFEQSAVIAPVTTVVDFGPVSDQRIALRVNGELQQEAKLSDMIHNVSAIIADLSTLYHLVPGDVIMTGTPAGVGPVRSGDTLVGEIDGLAPVTLDII